MERVAASGWACLLTMPASAGKVLREAKREAMALNLCEWVGQAAWAWPTPSGTVGV